MNRHGGKVAIFSLSEQGEALARDLTALFPGAKHHHGGESFQDKSRQAFSDGYDCIFICATGIVIRTLASVLGDKHSDPAVVVLDERGKFVIPLLSSHEGGGGEMARSIADALSAQCVVTSATDYGQPVYAVGMGCIKLCPKENLEQIMQKALDTLPGKVKVSAIASIDIKSDEPGLIAMARENQLELATFPASELRKVEDRLSEKSEVVFQEVGCYGVAEAAALQAATGITGQPAELVVNKIKGKGATAAVARSFLQ